LPHVSLEMSLGRYGVKVATGLEEMQLAYKLRYQSFFGRLASAVAGGLDYNEYDIGADHLIVKEGSEVIGTYRLRCSKFVDTYFSESEFEIADFLGLGGVYLELSRACIAPSKRQGAVIMCLWRGLKQYIDLVGANYLFGCSSVYTSDPVRASMLQTYLQDAGHFADGYGIRPRGEFVIDGYERGARGVVSDIISPLLLTYMKMGAKVYGDPAHDMQMACMDYFTVMDTAELRGRYATVE